MPTVIGLGEVLWDCFPDRRLPGGAPANVAFHAQQLGWSAAVATRVGTDPLGAELLDFLAAQGLSTELVQRDPAHGTGTVTVQPGVNAAYEFLEHSAWDFLEASEAWLAAMAQARAVAFGTLAQRGAVSRAAIYRCLEATSPEAIVVYDINLRPPFFERQWIERSLALSTIAKLNDDEVRTLRPLLGAPAGDDERFARWLRERSGLEAVCVTRGGRGALVASDAGVVDLPGVAVTVADTVGAGDAFTAGLIGARLWGWPWDRAAELANRMGALVASRAGAMPALRAEFAALSRTLQVCG
jgi:fructokinase